MHGSMLSKNTILVCELARVYCSSTCVPCQKTSEASFLVSVQSMHKVFFEAYDWRSFLLALGCSLLGMAIMAVVENLILRPLLKGICPSYFDRQPAPPTVPHQKLNEADGKVPSGTSAYPGGVQPSAPKLNV